MEIEGARVLITGASSGIGAAAARLLAQKGATVGLVARRADRLDEVLADCRGHTPESERWVVDLSDLDAAEGVVVEAWDRWGGLDALVNNAALPKRRHITHLTFEELDDIMRLNFESPARMTMAVLPRMLERDRGVIVNVSSMGGRVGIADESAYCASKFALCGWSESLALDLWHTGVEVRLVIPGPIDTEIWHRPDNEPARYDGELFPPEVVAEGIAAAIGDDRFEYYCPDLKGVVEFKSADIDAYLAGAAEALKPPECS